MTDLRPKPKPVDAVVIPRNGLGQPLPGSIDEIEIRGTITRVYRCVTGKVLSPALRWNESKPGSKRIPAISRFSSRALRYARERVAIEGASIPDRVYSPRSGGLMETNPDDREHSHTTMEGRKVRVPCDWRIVRHMCRCSIRHDWTDWRSVPARQHDKACPIHKRGRRSSIVPVRSLA